MTDLLPQSNIYDCFHERHDGIASTPEARMRGGSRWRVKATDVVRCVE